ncbi:unnamed protein product [Caenorhabditis bovis]|uniref:Uncharacterized protein n=1 Tax=Caenorhabditis bovis TaxID=2654633 RepID=A0A8S1EKV5_9PELO|nr:unnamed protein product [Caenorhabditis bovis]
MTLKLLAAVAVFLFLTNRVFSAAIPKPEKIYNSPTTTKEIALNVVPSTPSISTTIVPLATETDETFTKEIDEIPDGLENTGNPDEDETLKSQDDQNHAAIVIDEQVLNNSESEPKEAKIIEETSNQTISVALDELPKNGNEIIIAEDVAENKKEKEDEINIYHEESDATNNETIVPTMDASMIIGSTESSDIEIKATPDQPEYSYFDLISCLIFLLPSADNPSNLSWWDIIIESVRCSMRECNVGFVPESPMYWPKIIRRKRGQPECECRSIEVRKSYLLCKKNEKV